MIQDYAEELCKARDDLDALQKEYDKKFQEARARLQKAEYNVSLSTSVYNADKVIIALDAVLFRGLKWYGEGDTVKVVDNTIRDIANGCKVFDKEYFYAKNYDRYVCQGGTCSYGCGPRHGNVVFEIAKRKRHEPLTPEQIDAVLYVLYNLKDAAFRTLVLDGQK